MFKFIPWKKRYAQSNAYPTPYFKERLIFIFRLSIFLISIGLISYVIYKYIFLLQKEPVNIKIFGNSILTDQEILEHLKLNEPTIGEIDTYELTLRIQEHHWVKEGLTRIIFPLQVEIYIEERQPKAFYNNRQKIFFVDDKSMLLPIREISHFQNLPVISDNTLKIKNNFGKLEYYEIHQVLNFLNFLEENNEILSIDNIADIDISNPLYFKVLTVPSDIQLLLDYKNFQESVRYLKHLMPHFFSIAKQIESIDLRYKDKVIVRKK